ncbi:methyltransferase family protein [Lignipirellula cremea]|uniref:Isoprenylcysteine carboxyl methyltransferase (ICMT) family protein n=1 Tax=Lignipirellula cremea TaxID=2528010 RepID=A0A518DLQ8_9BACT|nr:methyltransferase [Lignipirellula cremea]QDU92777.1 Isoprenylcysteine carboxyl methyltransferase (ICMT) family protein [Lignipirellula cremea]
MNAALGLSAIFWSVQGLLWETPGARFTTVRLCIAALNLCVGMLFLTRRPLVRDSSWRDILLALPSFLAGGMAFRLAPAPLEWPWYATALFTIGSAAAITSLLQLGRCFAIFPAVRGVVSRGPYRFLRHPAYAAELLLVFACFTAGPHLLSAFCLVVLIPCLAARIRVEERLLCEQSDYREYTRQVAWRLLPGVW